MTLTERRTVYFTDVFLFDAGESPKHHEPAYCHCGRREFWADDGYLKYGCMNHDVVTACGPALLLCNIFEQLRPVINVLRYAHEEGPHSTRVPLDLS